MGTTNQHPLSQAFIQSASVIIGHRQEIRDIHPLNQNEIQRECDSIKAGSPRILQVALDELDGTYVFKYRLQEQKFQIHCTPADSPVVAFYYGVNALKSDGISCKLSFPKPIIKDFRPSPLTQQQEVSARRDLGVLFINFKEDIDDALTSTLQIDYQLNLLEAILTDFENAEWDDEVAGGVLARRIVGEAQEWVENEYQFKVREIEVLPDDERQRRSATPRNLPHSEANDTPARRITLAELALIEVYESRHLDIEAANRLACKYGYNSGQRLLKDYNAFDGKPSKRIGLDKSRPRNWMVKRLEYILPLLSTAARQRAEKELQTLLTHTNYKD